MSLIHPLSSEEIAKLKRDTAPPAPSARRQSHLARGVRPSSLDYERILGTNDMVDVNYLERGLLAARSVGRIILADEAGRLRGYGTGFIVSPSLAMTNWHVLPDADAARTALIEFDYQLDVLGEPLPSEKFRLRPDIFFYSHQSLDFALVAVESTGRGGRALRDFGWLRLNPDSGKIDEKEWISIIQHPSGEMKRLAIRENQLLKLTPTTLWYASDTAQGSSGSPLFNDSWQVVGLHHSGVPARDDQGRILGLDDRPAQENPSEDQVKWLANEGIRISSIVEHMRGASAADGAMRDEFLARTLPETAKPDWGRGKMATAVPVETGAAAIVPAPGGGVLVTVPVQLYVGTAPPPPPAIPVIAAAAPKSEVTFESFHLDPDYETRPGYDEDFLGAGLMVPLPTVDSDDVVPQLNNGRIVLPYRNYSVVMCKSRRLLHFAAGNSDRRRKGKLSRKAMGRDLWVRDPRIPAADQIGNDELYAGTLLDLGHVIRREDAYWGDDEESAQLANFDTFHYTNCTPQHEAFNRSSKHGLWGELENLIGAQSKNDRISLFAGPIFADDDIEYTSRVTGNRIRLPGRFWKILLCEGLGGQMTAYAFILDQTQQLKAMQAALAAPEERMTFVPGPFSEEQVTVAAIQKATCVRFAQEVHRADVLKQARPDIERLVLTEAASVVHHQQ